MLGAVGSTGGISAPLPTLQKSVLEHPEEEAGGVVTKRAVSTRTRFEIFKRDGFRCLYCGGTPLQGALHVDHVVPLAEGGDNATANLVTACGECNLGKGPVPLDRKRLAPSVATQADRDHAQQILDFLAIQREVAAAKAKVTDVVADRWEELIGPLSQQMYGRLGGIVQRWPMEKVEEAMQITARKMGTAGQEFSPYTSVQQAKYFQGILRVWREHPEDGQ